MHDKDWYQQKNGIHVTPSTKVVVEDKQLKPVGLYVIILSLTYRLSFEHSHACCKLSVTSTEGGTLHSFYSSVAKKTDL